MTKSVGLVPIVKLVSSFAVAFSALDCFVLLAIIISTTYSIGLPTESWIESYSKTGIYDDVPQDYMRWSNWYHKQLEERLNRTSSTSLPTAGPVHIPSKMTAITSPLPTDNEIRPFSITTASSLISTTILMNMTEGVTQTLTENSTKVGMNYTTGVSALLATLTAITSFITVGGNLLVLLSFFVERALRTATNYFIASLAVTDLLIGVFSMNFYTLYLILGHWPLGRLFCDLWLSVDYTACLTSQYTVLIITIDRFCSVRLPAKYRNWRTDRKVSIMVAATWIIPSSVFFTTIMGWPYFNTQVLPRPLDQCYAEFANDPIFNTIFTLCYFWVTLCVMIGLYCGIYKVAVNLQKRSDEKRNRVSGLINNSTGAATSFGMSTVSRVKTGTMNQKQPAKKVNQATMHSSSVAGESSGFDSDEEQQKKFNSAQTNNKQTNENATNNAKKGNTNFQSILPANLITREELEIIPGLNLSNLTSNRIGKQATVKPEGNLKFENFEQKPNSSPMKRKPTQSIDCPVHGRSSIISLNGQSDYCRYSPASVSMYHTDGIQISSPLVADEDSGFEANGIGQHQFISNYLPSSPALCICSDLEEELEVETVDSTPPAQCSSQAKTEGQTVQTTQYNNSPSHIALTPVAPAKSVAPPVDREYQDRVMENFRRRIAAVKGMCTSESHDSDYLTSSNPSSQQPSVGKLNGNPDLKSNPVIRSKIDESRTHTTNQADFTSQYQYFDTGTGDSEIESTPLWVPQPMRVGNQLSASGSIRELPCCYGHSTGEYYDDQPECLICAGQQESDTLQSSSTYADYADAGLEREPCFCQINARKHDRAQVRKSTHWLTQMRQRLPVIPFSQAHTIILERIQSALSRRREGSKHAPVERGRRENRARKALRTITFILGAFVLCWTPYHVVIMIKGICDDIVRKYTCVNDILYSVTYWLCYMNSPINPFCYALANAQFKKTFLRIFHGDFRRT